MNVLAIDVGSSSVKMGVLSNGRLVGASARQTFPTRYDGTRAEVNPDAILRAIALAAAQLPAKRRARVDCIALSTMCPSWLAMDAKGRPLTPIVTHQDRRSSAIAIELERRVGKARHLAISGNRPVPGGISSTTCAWFLRHEKSLMRRADLVGHLPTYLHRHFCGARAIDPSHASFMGLYETVKMGGWSVELCDAIGLSRSLLPEIHDSAAVSGKINASTARRLGVPHGMPMLVGMIDTGAAMLLTGAAVGQLVHVAGTTDVLALATDKPVPNERLLLRALGTGHTWLSVGTIAAAGSSLNWARNVLFSHLSEKQFYARCTRLARDPASAGSARFEPYLAGDRCSVEQRLAEFAGLSLASGSEQMLAAMINGLAKVSADRIELLSKQGTKLRREVMISGGGGGALAEIMHRDWPGKWTYRAEAEATMRGLGQLAAVRSKL